MLGILGFVTGRNACKDSPYSWFVALIACAFSSLVSGFAATSGVLFVIIQDRYDVTKQKASYPVNALLSANFLFGIFSGPILHRFKAKKTLILSSILGLLGSCLSVFSPLNDPIKWLVICMTIRGAGSSLAVSTSFQVVSSHFEKDLSKALVLVSLAFPIGGLFLPGIVRLSWEVYGLEPSWLIHGAVYCQALLLAILIRPRSDENRPIKGRLLETIADGRNQINVAGAKVKIDKEQPRSADVESFGSILSALFHEKAFYLLCVSQTVILGCVMGVRMTVLDFGRDIHLNPELNLYITEILSFSELARIPISIIIDARLCYEETISAVASIVAASTLLLMTLTTGYVFLTMAFLYTVCFAAGVTTRGTLLVALGPGRIATAYGITSTCSGLFQLTLPFLIGLFRDVYGLYDYLYYLFSLLNFILAVAFVLHRARHWFSQPRV